MRRTERQKFTEFGLPFHVQKQLEKLWDTLTGTVNETMQFNLAHIFGRELLHIIDQNIQEAAILPELTQLMEHQIKVFAQEALGPSIHPPYHITLNRKSWQQGQVDLRDARYLQKNGMLEMSRMAVHTAATPAERQRYKLETLQIEQAIYPWVAQNLQNPQLSILPASSTEQAWLNKTLPPIQSIFLLGERHAYFLPKNTIYAEDLAFINFCQLLYIPGSDEQTLSPAQIRTRIQSGKYSGKISIIIEPVLGDISNQDLTKAVRHWSETTDSTEKSKPLTEKELMSHLHRVPEWAGVGVGREFILSALTQVLDESHPVLAQANERQQRVENIMNEQSWNITQGATFLAKILAAELANFSELPLTEQQHFATQLPMRLHFAFGLVASPLLQRQTFDPKLAFAAYTKRFSRKQAPSDMPSEKINVTETMRQMMTDPEWLRNARHVRLNKVEQQKTTESLRGLPSYYLNRIVANTACNIFSFGGYAEQLAKLNTPGAFSIMNGRPVRDRDLWQQYYPHMKLSGMGVCVEGKNCQVYKETGDATLEQMLGPCGVCLSCQMFDDWKHLAETNLAPDPVRTTHTDLFRDSLIKASEMRPGRLQANDLLPTFLTPETKVDQFSRQWR